jgi:hypothetical protein
MIFIRTGIEAIHSRSSPCTKHSDVESQELSTGGSMTMNANLDRELHLV